MLTGRAPSAGASPDRVTETRPAALKIAIPPELAEDRYQSAVSLAAELRSVVAMLDIRSGAREPPSVVTAKEGPSGSSSGWLHSLLAVLALAFAAWLWLR